MTRHRHRDPLLSAEGLRRDGRRPEEIRQLDCEWTSQPPADGTATLVVGLSEVLASVFGPREALKYGDTEHDRAILKVEVSMLKSSMFDRMKANRQDRTCAELALALEQIFGSIIQLHLYPRSQITVSIQIKHNGGGYFSASVNAMTLALMSAGVPLVDFVCAATVGLSDDGKTLLHDLTSDEIGAVDTRIDLAITPDCGRIAYLRCESSLDASTLETLMDGADQACRSFHTRMRDLLIARTHERLERRCEI